VAVVVAVAVAEQGREVVERLDRGAARKKRERESGEIRGGRPRVLLLLLLLLLPLAVRAAARRE
jgi:hypothetical protein